MNEVIKNALIRSGLDESFIDYTLEIENAVNEICEILEKNKFTVATGLMVLKYAQETIQKNQICGPARFSSVTIHAQTIHTEHFLK